jgi:uncharacterized protein
MGIIYYKKPRLKNPVLLASWPGIGNIGLVAVDYMRSQLEAEPLGEIEPWEFFYPNSVTIKAGIIEKMEFPASLFYYKHLGPGKGDILLFVAEEQPHDRFRRYAEGTKAYRMAQQVVDVAEKYGCRRIYTSGAAVALSHHATNPRIWAVPNGKGMREEISGYPNTALMSEIYGREGQGTISGLNGLLLGVAHERGIEALCLMGEIPAYLQGMPLPYPKASRAILEVLSKTLGIKLDMTLMDQWVLKVEDRIEELMEEFNNSLPPQIRDGVKEGLEKLRGSQPRIGKLTEMDAKRAIAEIEKFFKKGGKGDDEKSL